MNRLFYLFTTNLLFYTALKVGQLSICIFRRHPFAGLCNFYCCQ